MFNMKEYQREYFQKNKERIYKRQKVYCKTEKYRKYHREYNTKHRDKCREQERKNYLKNKERKLGNARNYYKKHKEKANARRLNCYHNKLKYSLDYKINERMHNMIYLALRKNKGGRHWNELVGYSFNELKEHLRKQFQDGMTWERFMAGEIHIDHIVPKSHFKYTTSEDPQFKECWALYNLQPLWANENIAKGNRNYQLPLPLYL